MYSGLRTIGGVVASVTYKTDRVVFEFGSAYDPSTAVFDGKVEGRRRNWIVDRLKVGILPRIDGIYRKEDLMDYPLQSAEESSMNTAVFITHLHLDHMACMGMISPLVPVYLHHNAQVIERALEAAGCGIETVDRDYRDIEPGKPIRVGAIEVLPILCNDTSYCDFAFLITTPDGTVHWTGDLTLHGLQAYRTLEQLEILKSREIDVLLCDATAFMDSTLAMTVPDKDPMKIKASESVPEGMMDDRQYYQSLFDRIKDLQGLCVFNYYQREMDDAQRLMDWARQLGRICAFEPESAYIVYRFFGIRPFVYLPDSPSVSQDSAWMNELLANSVIVTLDQVLQSPSHYMIQNSYERIMELFSLPSSEAVYLHMDGIPIGTFDPCYANMRKIVDRTGFAYMTCFCESYFGHGYPQQVKFFVDQAKAHVLIPCHSYSPERLTGASSRQLLPEMGQAYLLKDHDLIKIRKESEDA